MRSLVTGTVALAAVLLMGLAAPIAPMQAQASGDTLARQAGNIKAAILTGTAEELFNAHAPWLQERARMVHEETGAMIAKSLSGSKEEADAINKEVVEGVKEFDPNGQLGLKSAADVKALTPEKLHALFWGFYRLRGNAELDARLKARWYQVDREVTEEVLPDGDGPVGSYKSRIVGKVEYRNANYRDRITVKAVAEGSSWHVTEVDFRIALFEPLDLMALMSESALRSGNLETEVLDAKRAEGEQILMSARDQCRVQYSKTAVPPAELTDTGADMEWFEGKYFQLRSKVLKNSGGDRGGIVAEPTENAGELGYGLLTFRYVNSNSEIKWYVTIDGLDAAIKAFEESK